MYEGSVLSHQLIVQPSRKVIACPVILLIRLHTLPSSALCMKGVAEWRFQRSRMLHGSQLLISHGPMHCERIQPFSSRPYCKWSVLCVCCWGLAIVCTDESVRIGLQLCITSLYVSELILIGTVPRRCQSPWTGCEQFRNLTRFSDGKIK